MLLFHLKRMKKCTGVIVGIGGKDRIQECYSYVKKVQSILSRTFSAEDIVETFGKTGGGGTATLILDTMSRRYGK